MKWLTISIFQLKASKTHRCLTENSMDDCQHLYESLWAFVSFPDFFLVTLTAPRENGRRSRAMWSTHDAVVAGIEDILLPAIKSPSEVSGQLIGAPFPRRPICAFNQTSVQPDGSIEAGWTGRASHLRCSLSPAHAPSILYTSSQSQIHSHKWQPWRYHCPLWGTLMCSCLCGIV